MVVLVQDPAAAGVDLLVALAGTSHAERRVHVHVVTSHIQRNQTLEDDRPPGPGRAEEHQQTRCCAPIRHHVQHGTEGSRLVEVSCRISV